MSINKFHVSLLLSVVLLFGVHRIVFPQEIEHWESILQTGDSVRYIAPAGDIGTTWTEIQYNDNSWKRAPMGLGYGDNDDNTVLATGTVSVYIRYEFFVNDPAQILSLLLDADYDDGYIAYLNGVEIARRNITDPVFWNTTADNLHEATLYAGEVPERISLDNLIPNRLLTGKNILAIEVHNQSETSSDLSSNFFLHAGLSVKEMIYGPVPDWFDRDVNFDEFNLPLMVINTNGQIILDEVRIIADMGLIKNEISVLNKPGDPQNEYSGKIAIEIRGESSAHFEKQSYSIELQNPDGTNNNVSILGLPPENDFVLYGPYSDKTMVKNVLIYELFRRTGRWAPRTRYIELFLNNEYRGVYVFTEKIKRDENRVDIDILTGADESIPSISGGYILRRDKKEDLTRMDFWTSGIEQPFHQQMWYEYFDPEIRELTYDQSLYIKNWMKNFDYTMSGSMFNDFEKGYYGFIRGNELYTNVTIPDHELKNIYNIRIESNDESFSSIAKDFEIQVINDPTKTRNSAHEVIFSLYPNPTSDYFQVKATGNENSNLKVQLINISGEVLEVYNGTPDEINSQLYVDTYKLKVGLYFIKIDSGSKTYYLKSVKI